MMVATTDPDRASACAPVNEIRLVGRLAAPAQERELPSGDLLVSWRLVVDRPARRRSTAARAPTVDTLDCAAFLAGPRRAALALGAGDVVSVHGALRRRFWRAPTGGAASRYEVEVTVLRRLARGDGEPAAGPTRGQASR